jgi:hypothetical protein
MLVKLTVLDENTKTGSDVFFPVTIIQDDRGFQADFVDDGRHDYGRGPQETAVMAVLTEFFNRIHSPGYFIPDDIKAG